MNEVKAELIAELMGAYCYIKPFKFCGRWEWKTRCGKLIADCQLEMLRFELKECPFCGLELK